jgi:hypothetical protein
LSDELWGIFRKSIASMEIHNGCEWAVAPRFGQVAFNRVRGRFQRFATLLRQAPLELAELDWSTFEPDQFLRHGDGVGANARNEYC